MNKIDTTSWKEYYVGNLFPDIKKPKVYHTREVVEDSSGIPYIVRSKFNNGIKCRIRPEGLVRSPKGVITFGAENAAFFYQDEEWCGGRDIYYIDTRNIHPYACMYLVACLNQITEKYTYSFGLFPDLMKREKIKLPSKNEEPDWQYMEDYMRSLEQKTESTILTLMATKFSQLNIDTTYWKEFTLYSNDLFDIDMGTKLDRAKMTKSNPKINFVGRGSVHNGVVDIVDEISGIEPYQAGYITISLGGSIGASFVQDKPFYTSQNVCVLKPKHNMSYYSKEFIVTMIKNEGQRRYKAFSDELNRHIRTDFTIKLPATPSGDPDWHYMEMYMRGVEAIVKNKLSLLVPHKQELALKDAANVTFNNANVTYIDQSRTYNVK